MVAISAMSPAFPHRVISAADKITPPTISAAKNDSTAGKFSNVQRGVAIISESEVGPCTVSNIVLVTPTALKSINITVPAVPGAARHHVFVSTSATEPKYVGTVLETMLRAGGATITDVNTVVAGGGANVINVQDDGTGLPCTDADFQYNNAYIIPVASKFVCKGPITLIAHIDMSVANFLARPELEIIPFWTENEIDPTVWYHGDVTKVPLLTEDGASYHQTYTLDIIGTRNVVLLANKIVGTATIRVELAPS